MMLPPGFYRGFLFGGLWALIPAFFKARFGANETILTLMLNYIALQFIASAVWAWRDPKAMGFPNSYLSRQCYSAKSVWGSYGLDCRIAVGCTGYLVYEENQKGFEIAGR